MSFHVFIPKGEKVFNLASAKNEQYTEKVFNLAQAKNEQYKCLLSLIAFLSVPP